MISIFYVKVPPADCQKVGQIIRTSGSSVETAKNKVALFKGCPISGLKVVSKSSIVLGELKNLTAFNVSDYTNIVSKNRNQHGTSYLMDDGSRLYIPKNWYNSWKAFNAQGLVVAEFKK